VNEVALGNLDVAQKLLDAKPDKDLEARVKRMRADCDKALKTKTQRLIGNSRSGKGVRKVENVPATATLEYPAKSSDYSIVVVPKGGTGPPCR
jgi:hypothetical protein